MNPAEFKAWRDRWKRYGDYQQLEKTKFLRRLTPKQGIKMFFDLHAFAEESFAKGKMRDPESDAGRIRNLARIHALFMSANP